MSVTTDVLLWIFVAIVLVIIFVKVASPPALALPGAHISKSLVHIGECASRPRPLTMWATSVGLRYFSFIHLVVDGKFLESF